ncbi:MAG: glycosyltransferase family 9 protein [Sporomusaceae bacterium]|nr:glycosyltransferase family 9 protein [Sporomusaceae bacterium]
MEPKKIFVSKRGGLGDALLATPILRGIKEKYPNSKLTVMIFPNAYDFISGLPFVDEVIAYDKKKNSSLSVIKKIWKFDIAIFLDWQYRPALLAWLARVPIRTGIAHKRRKLLTHPVALAPDFDSIYEPINFSNILEEGIGLHLDTDLTKLEIAPIPETAQQSVSHLLAQAGIGNQPYIAMAPFTAYAPKDWPFASYVELVAKLQAATSYPILMIGGPQDQSRVLPSKAINLVGKTSLLEMAELIRRAKVLVGSCSGHMHVAAAVDTPVVVLYGPGSSARWAPKKRAAIVSLNLPCSPCDSHGVCEVNRCMLELSVDTVYSAVMDTLRSLDRREKA